MIPTFVISLPDCGDRRAAISDRLGQLGVAFEFVDGVDGRDGLDPAWEDQIDRVEARRARDPMSDVEFACALSHVRCYRRIVADGIPYAMVLEDDVIPAPDLPRYLAGGYHGDAAVTQLYVERPYVRRKGAKPLFGDYVSWLRAPRIEKAGAAAYVMSLDAARHFIERATPVSRAADWPDCAEDLIARREWRVIHPSIVGHPPQEGQSLIDAHGRLEARKNRKFLDGRHRRKLRRTYGSLPRKLLCKRLPRA